MTARAKVIAYVALPAIGVLLAPAASGNPPNGQGSIPEKDATAGSTAPFSRPGSRVTGGCRVEAFPSAQNAK